MELPCPRIKPVPPTLEAWSLNFWTTKEVQHWYSLMWKYSRLKKAGWMCVYMCIQSPRWQITYLPNIKESSLLHILILILGSYNYILTHFILFNKTELFPEEMVGNFLGTKRLSSGARAPRFQSVSRDFCHITPQSCNL